jgi:hypothetical protein
MIRPDMYGIVPIGYPDNPDPAEFQPPDDGFLLSNISGQAVQSFDYQHLVPAVGQQFAPAGPGSNRHRARNTVVGIGRHNAATD